METKALDTEYIAGTYARFPVEIVSGEGAIAHGADGKKYIDMGSGIAVNTFGYADEEWRKAVTEQLGKVQHTSNLYYTSPCALLAKTLCERTGMKKVFFANSGAEANEGAIKAARKYAAEKYGANRYTIVTLENSFHGRTLTTLAATGQSHYHELYQPLTPGFVHAPADDADAVIETARANNAAAILMERVQGEGGVRVLDSEFVKKIAAWAKESDTLLMMDEVQTGNGRTGYLYAYMRDGIEPDIVTTAKGLGGGLPIGAVMLGDKVKDVFGPGDHGSTFGGNPAVCAGALSVMNRLTEEMLFEVRRKGDLVRAAFEGAKGVKDVSGLGLMIGVLPEKSAGEIVKKCIEKGVLCITAKDRVRLMPPLNIPDETLMEAVNIIRETIAE